MKDKKNRYILIPKDLQKNLIEFLDDIQIDAAKNNTHEDMHLVNYCSWAIEELLNGFDAKFNDKKPPQKKSRDQYLDETFMDWNLPKMDDEEYEKLVDQFDNFLRAWENNYYKDNPKDKSKKKRKPKQERKDNPNYKSKKPYVPPFEDVAEYMSLEEIKEYLLEDDELTDEERFDLYYEEHRRVEDKKNSLSYEQLLKGAGIKPAGWKPKKK